MEDALGKLREMTNNLPRVVDFDDFVNFVDEDYIEYSVQGGRCFGIVLMSKESVGVTKIFLSKGAIFPINKPNVVQIISIFRGKIEVHVGEKKIILGVGDTLRIADDEEFGAIGLDDSWAINITIPRRKDYTLPEKHG